MGDIKYWEKKRLRKKNIERKKTLRKEDIKRKNTIKRINWEKKLQKTILRKKDFKV